MGTVYKLDFANGKSYIGITTKSLNERIKHHARDAANGSEYSVHKAWRKHGEPVLTVLAVVEDRDLAGAEIRAIKAFNTLVPNGYNMTPGGEESPMLVPEIKAKLIGLKRSDESRAKMSASKKGSMSEEHRQKLKDIHSGNSYRLGKPRSDMCGDKNPMRNPEIAAKCIEARKRKVSKAEEMQK